MKQRDWYYIISFIIAFIALSYFLKGATTGRVVQTMQCTDAGCYEFCMSHSDCYPDQLCCESLGRGVCVKECQKEYLFTPEIQGLPPHVEEPNKQDMAFYHMLLIVSTCIAFIYAYHRWKEN
jgi:hypothetical protein